MPDPLLNLGRSPVGIYASNNRCLVVAWRQHLRLERDGMDTVRMQTFHDDLGLFPEVLNSPIVNNYMGRSD